DGGAAASGPASGAVSDESPASGDSAGSGVGSGSHAVSNTARRMEQPRTCMRTSSGSAYAAPVSARPGCLHAAGPPPAAPMTAVTFVDAPAVVWYPRRPGCALHRSARNSLWILLALAASPAACTRGTRVPGASADAGPIAASDSPATATAAEPEDDW